MANMSSFSLLNEKVKKYQEDYGLDAPGLAFERLAVSVILNLLDSEVEDVITDGPMDGGLDAIYIEGKTVHIFNFKYANDFENSKKNFPEDEINQVIVTMQRIFQKEISKDDVNELVWEKVEQIYDAFESSHLDFHFYFCSNKEYPAQHARDKFETALNEFRHVSFSYYNQEDVVNRFIEKKYPQKDGVLKFIDKQFFERSEGNIRGLIAAVGAKEIIDLVKDENNDQIINEEVFNENVRVYLKLKNKINEDIYNTALSDDNSEFWYLNNGITIVCEQFEYNVVRSPQVKLINFQIVNGGQTTHALFEANLQNAEKIDDVLVLVKIYATNKNKTLSEKISETTNRQNPIKTRDLHSNDKIQKILEEEFLELDYYYERKKNQHQDQVKNKRLDNELLGQIFMSYYLNMPSEAKAMKALIFGDKYDDIFNDTLNARKMLMPYKLYLKIDAMKKEIQKKKRNQESVGDEETFIPFAVFHILSAIRLMSEKDELTVDGDSDNSDLIDKAKQMVLNLSKRESSKMGNQYSHEKYFKNPKTSKALKKYILES